MHNKSQAVTTTMLHQNPCSLLAAMRRQMNHLQVFSACYHANVLPAMCFCYPATLIPNQYVLFRQVLFQITPFLRCVVCKGKSF